jgi:hypothetical protein
VPRPPRTIFVCLFAAAILVLLAVPAGAFGQSANVRIESKSGPLVTSAPFALSTAPVAPAGALPGQTCPGNSVVGAINAATGGNWGGTWSDTDGWSVERIKSTTALVSEGRKWLVLVQGVLVNDPPCHVVLDDGASVTLMPACLTATTGCFAGGLLDLVAPDTAGPGSPIVVQVWETTFSLDSEGHGSSQRGPGGDATVSGPEGSARTNSTFNLGKATLFISVKGPATIFASKGADAPDRSPICITDGADGFCGTTAPAQQPFDPLAFCTTTGSDGYCGSPDMVAPIGRISQPVENHVFPKTGRPKTMKGTVDFDPSQTDHVDLKLMRQTTIKVKRYRKRKVWVTKKIHGKKVRRRVTKRRAYYVKQKACLGWDVATSTWKRLRTCDAATAKSFPADGTDEWSYQFLTALPAGRYTLDALAVDGAGNQDKIPEAGRNRIQFTVN